MANPPPQQCSMTNSSAYCVCIVKLIAIISFIATPIIILILHGIYNASSSKFLKFDIDSLTVSNLNLSDPSNSSHWNIRMHINIHRSDLSFEFSSNLISIFYESQEDALWQKNFDVNAASKPTVHLNLNFWGSLDNVNGKTVKILGGNIANTGTVRFDVHFSSYLKSKFKHRRIQNWLWETDVDTYIEFSCEVQLFFKSSEKMQADMLINDSQACKVVESIKL